MGGIHTSVTEAREFFAGELTDSLQRNKVRADKSSVDYLVELLMRYLRSDKFFVVKEDGKLSNNVLAELYFSYIQGNSEQKTGALKRLGDICLLVTGLFPDSLNRKMVDIDYYFGMGGSAYATLANFQITDLSQSLFSELSHKFVPFANVLSEMSEKNGLQSNTDLLRLYERWLLTGNDHLKSRLAQHGIASPVKIETKTKH